MKGPAVEWQQEGQSSTGGEGCRMRETPDSRSQAWRAQMLRGRRAGGSAEKHKMSANPSRAPTPSPAEDSSVHSRCATGHGDLDLTQLHSLH